MEGNIKPKGIIPCIKKNACTGCGACVAACPHNCIFMRSDNSSSLYPSVDTDACTNCGLCRSVCPVGEKSGEILRRIQSGSCAGDVYAAWSKDRSIRMGSSSGGVFTELALKVIDRGGCVVGAALDESLALRHVIVDTREGLEQLRGSKYLQSEIPAALYKAIRDFLKQGRLVLFSGVPCQVAGLKSYLLHEYDNLICCDILCHGVPARILFDKYIAFRNPSVRAIVNVHFRNKKHGWKGYGLSLDFADGSSTDPVDAGNDLFLTGFLRDYALRESCYDCPFKSTARVGDITLGDYWGVGKRNGNLDPYNEGTSLVIVNTEKGRGLFLSCGNSIQTGQTPLEWAVSDNSFALGVCKGNRPVQRNTFCDDLVSMDFEDAVRKYRLGKEPRWIHIYKRGKSLIRKIIRQIRRA